MCRTQLFLQFYKLKLRRRGATGANNNMDHIVQVDYLGILSTFAKRNRRSPGEALTGIQRCQQ